MENRAPVNDIVSSLMNQIHRLEERKPSFREVIEFFKGVIIAGAELRSELADFPPPRIAPPELTRLAFCHSGTFLAPESQKSDGLDSG